MGTMTTVDSILEHLAKAQWHLSQAVALGHNMPENPIVVTEESLKAIKRAGIDTQQSLGWVSDMYRCGDECPPANGAIGAAPHAAHSYGPNKGQWCDGYI